MGFDHSMLAEIREMLRNLDLRGAEDVLKMANAKRANREQMQNAQPRFIAQTFVNFDQIHVSTIYAMRYIRQEACLAFLRKDFHFSSPLRPTGP